LIDSEPVWERVRRGVVGGGGGGGAGGGAGPGVGVATPPRAPPINGGVRAAPGPPGRGGRPVVRGGAGGGQGSPPPLPPAGRCARWLAAGGSRWRVPRPSR